MGAAPAAVTGGGPRLGNRGKGDCRVGLGKICSNAIDALIWWVHVPFSRPSKKMSLTVCTGGDAAAAAAAATWTPPYCTIVAADMSDFSYLSCPLCARALPDRADTCATCSSGLHAPARPAPPTRVYRLLLSVATHNRVVPVVLFDRAAHALLGCPAEELAGLLAVSPGAARAAEEAMVGEMCRMALRAPEKGSGDRLRAVSVEPLRDGFRPVIDTLRALYPRG